MHLVFSLFMRNEKYKFLSEAWTLGKILPFRYSDPVMAEMSEYRKTRHWGEVISYSETKIVYFAPLGFIWEAWLWWNLFFNFMCLPQWSDFSVPGKNVVILLKTFQKNGKTISSLAKTSSLHPRRWTYMFYSFFIRQETETPSQKEK